MRWECLDRAPGHALVFSALSSMRLMLSTYAPMLSLLWPPRTPASNLPSSPSPTFFLPSTFSRGSRILLLCSKYLLSNLFLFLSSTNHKYNIPAPDSILASHFFVHTFFYSLIHPSIHLPALPFNPPLARYYFPRARCSRILVSSHPLRTRQVSCIHICMSHVSRARNKARTPKPSIKLLLPLPRLFLCDLRFVRVGWSFGG